MFEQKKQFFWLFILSFIFLSCNDEHKTDTQTFLLNKLDGSTN